MTSVLPACRLISCWPRMRISVFNTPASNKWVLICGRTATKRHSRSSTTVPKLPPRPIHWPRLASSSLALQMPSMGENTVKACCWRNNSASFCSMASRWRSRGSRLATAAEMACNSCASSCSRCCCTDVISNANSGFSNWAKTWPATTHWPGRASNWTKAPPESL